MCIVYLHENALDRFSFLMATLYGNRSLTIEVLVKGFHALLRALLHTVSCSLQLG